MGLFICSKKSKGADSMPNDPYHFRLFGYPWTLSHMNTHPGYANRSPEEQAAYLDFLIEVLKRDIQGSYITGFFHERPANNKHLVFPIPAVFEDEDIPTIEKLPLQDKTIITFPRERRSIVDAICHIREEGFKPDRESANGDYYPQLNMVIIRNCQHHIAVAEVCKANPFASVCEYNLDKALGRIGVSRNGESWVRLNADGSEGEKIADVVDVRFALMYRFYEMSYELKRQSALQ